MNFRMKKFLLLRLMCALTAGQMSGRGGFVVRLTPE
jgi:hypothetical protein